VSQFVKHSTLIVMAQTIKNCILVTSSMQEIFIWNNRNDEKIMVVPEFWVQRIVEIGENFYGAR